MYLVISHLFLGQDMGFDSISSWSLLIFLLLKMGNGSILKVAISRHIIKVPTDLVKEEFKVPH